MFFRRQHPRTPGFAERLDELRRAGFTVDGARVSRNGCAAVVTEKAAGGAGILLGDEIATLVDGGFQKFFRAPSGKGRPALATDLEALHAFEEDLRQILGLPSLYNQALGTVSTSYHYDRLRGRE
jgi:hypothetical protein